MYIGTEGVYTYTFEHEKRPECPVCGGEVMDVDVKPDWTLQELIDWLIEKQDV
jgi:ubiquitin-activating enzyme E1 C